MAGTFAPFTPERLLYEMLFQRVDINIGYHQTLTHSRTLAINGLDIVALEAIAKSQGVPDYVSHQVMEEIKRCWYAGMPITQTIAWTVSAGTPGGPQTTNLSKTGLVRVNPATLMEVFRGTTLVGTAVTELTLSTSDDNYTVITAGHAKAHVDQEISRPHVALIDDIYGGLRLKYFTADGAVYELFGTGVVVHIRHNDQENWPPVSAITMTRVFY